MPQVGVAIALHYLAQAHLFLAVIATHQAQTHHAQHPRGRKHGNHHQYLPHIGKDGVRTGGASALDSRDGGTGFDGKHQNIRHQDNQQIAQSHHAPVAFQSEAGLTAELRVRFHTLYTLIINTAAKLQKKSDLSLIIPTLFNISPASHAIIATFPGR